MKLRLSIAILCASLAAVGCTQKSDDHQRPELRAALNEAQIGLRDSISVAVAQTTAGAPIQAALLLGNPMTEAVFAVNAYDVNTRKDIRVDTVSGLVVSVSPVGGGAPAPCPGAISLTEALAIAEAHANGDAIAVVPDDDVACAQEIQILSGTTLWEVKVAGDGAVLEYELSDEYGGSEDGSD